jgi:hypothetical protein
MTFKKSAFHPHIHICVLIFPADAVSLFQPLY